MTADSKQTVQTLDAISFPLYGKRLIEASAGTGKTYTIANLYLRLLIPGASASDLSRPLTVDQILVVTFTEAATAELKARIRNRIRQARRVLQRGESDDAFLTDLFSCIAETDKEAVVERLMYAEKQMDEAAIFTIHGFCQRMLSQNAFESRMLFQQEIETDETQPLRQAVRDTWRALMYPLSRNLAEAVKGVWEAPDAMQKDLALFQGQPDAKIADAEVDWQTWIARTEEDLKALREEWLQCGDELIELLDLSGFNGNFWSAKKHAKVRGDMQHWAHSQAMSIPDALKFFDAEEHRQPRRLNKSGQCPEHGFFAKVARLRANFPEGQALKPALLTWVRDEVASRLDKWRQESGKMTFTDLLTGLDKALAKEQGQALAERIRHLYPIALIDEFQDTDPVQYRVFSSLYEPANDAQNENGLILIGDPKQAIYAFRGADIYTYLRAREEVDSIHSLATNYRSSKGMVQAVNHLFNLSSSPFLVEGIPFVSVADTGAENRLLRDGKPLAALQWLYIGDATPIAKASFQKAMADQVAIDIHDWLLNGSTGRALVRGRPVQAKDIAILVSGYTEAQAIRSALAHRGIASVYLSDKGSVFSTQEARDLYLLLQAALHPEDEMVLRSALATRVLGLSLSELDQLNQDDLCFEDWTHRFQNYADIWQQEGVLPMLRTLMSELALAEKLRASNQGERRLTDWLHLGEKLQQKSRELESRESLLRYLKLSLENPDGNSDEQKIRLETDAELVRIVTVHKSKGLQYPLVYLPFALSPRESRDKHALFHDDRHQLWVAPNPNEEQQSLHETEWFAEQIRLAYVALTRAEEACFIGCAELVKRGGKKVPTHSDIHLSGLGSLLNHGNPLAMGDLQSHLQTLQKAWPEEVSELRLLSETPDVLPELSVHTATTDALSVRQFEGQIQKDWWVGSYSSLIVGEAGHERAAPGLDEPSIESAAELVAQESELEKEQGELALNRFSFPKGARPGTFLHDLLEGKPLQQTLAKPDFQHLIQAAHQSHMERYIEHQGYSPWSQVLFEWLTDMLHTPLIDGEARLVDIASNQCFREMEFFLPVSGMQARQLDHIARRYDAVSHSAPPIQERPLKGMLKGFVDLLFVWQGKYYVVDYKSNHLGDGAQAYHPEALANAIADHRYDLQYQLYTLALHRYLSSRLPDYNYDQHVGGVRYLFLRGLDRTGKNGVFSTRLPIEQVAEMDRLFTEGPSAQPASGDQYALF